MTAVLVVRADAPGVVTRLEDGLNGSTLDWCSPGAPLLGQSWDLILLANKDRTTEMVDWVADEVRISVKPGGKYQWRDSHE